MVAANRPIWYPGNDEAVAPYLDGSLPGERGSRRGRCRTAREHAPRGVGGSRFFKGAFVGHSATSHSAKPSVHCTNRAFRLPLAGDYGFGERRLGI